MARTFDAGDFDIHEAEKGVEADLISKKEKIKKGVLEDLKKSEKSKSSNKKKKSLIIAFVSQIVILGLGSVYLKKTKLSLILLAVNILFALFILPSFLVFGPDFPVIYVSAIAIFLLAIGWIYFFYLILRQN